MKSSYAAIAVDVAFPGQAVCLPRRTTPKARGQFRAILDAQ